MKKFLSSFLILALSFGSALPAMAASEKNIDRDVYVLHEFESQVTFAKDAVNETGLSSLSRKGFPETPTGRVLKSEYAAADGYVGASALSGIISLYAPEPFLTKAYAIASIIFGYTGATTTPVYFVSTAREYAVWDLERENIINYKYYLTTSAYEDAYHRHLITTATSTRDALSPMKIGMEFASE